MSRILFLVALLIIPNFTLNAQKTHSFTGGVETAWVRHYESGRILSHDQTNDITVDNSGNIYLTGISKDDYLTIKYNSNGDKVWERRYDGPENGLDEAFSLAVDGGGNVYVTGRSEVSGNSFDYITIKYNSNGDTLWVKRYNGIGNDNDEAQSLAVDESGNVYITGKSYGSDYQSDYATIKYNSNGDSIWVKRYNGSVNSYDGATSLAIDASRNVYVTGVSFGSGTHNDYATIKYNSSGDTVWVRRYNGPGNSDDYPSSLAVDGTGNVYVTGSSDGLGTAADYATIKYDSNGNAIWVKRYNGPGNNYDKAVALAVDRSENVYVTGCSYSSGTGNNYITIKYNVSGDSVWVRSYNGPGNLNDDATSIAIDGDGKVYVTGTSGPYGKYISGGDYATIKYNTNGDELWVNRYNGPRDQYDKSTSVAVDASGNVFVAGVSDSFYEYFEGLIGGDYATIKYNSNGNEVWTRLYNGPGNSFDIASSLVIDVNSNVYVTGSSYSYDRSFDYATIKYNSNGDSVWVRQYNGPANSEDFARALILDGSGNVYVTGSILHDYATIKYNSDGDSLWVKQYCGGPGYSSDQAYALAVDGSGNVYVTGYSYGVHSDYATIKYDSSGDSVWVRKYNGTGNADDEAKSLAIDKSGNVYITGESYGLGYQSDYATIKYNSNGDSIWVRRYCGPGYSIDHASSLAIDEIGNVYVTGYSGGDFATIKYNTNGDSAWVRRYSGGGATSLAIDSSGNVYVTGSADGDYATIKYNTNGDSVWIRRYNGMGNSNDRATSLAVDGTGNVYVTGSSGGEIVTIKYSAIGKEEWIANYSYGDGTLSSPVGIKVDASGNVYVAGSSSINGQSVYTVIKYRQTPSSIENDVADIPTQFELEQNYPNPFNPSTTIRYAIPTVGTNIRSSQRVILKIYDLLGREIEMLVNEEQSAGWKEVQWNPSGIASGIYFYKLQTGDFVDVKKLMLVK